MRVMALDIGEVRVGIAISDASMRIASPVKVLPAAEVRSCARSFRRVLEDFEPGLLVCGLPKTLSGEDGPQAARVRECAQNIAATCGLPLVFSDERLSSVEAKRVLREQGFSDKTMRGKVDMIAAGLFLQAWLDSQAHASHESTDATTTEFAPAPATAESAAERTAAEPTTKE
ncbi:Holliday junction resolvase RuvX [Atopobium deltae]|nr:Holliday junction resolvase RuvX [Atopobium deltae]